MGRKIFVSYKYADDNVKQLDYNYDYILPMKTTARRYVDKLEEKIGIDNIYKGENDGEDLSSLSDDSIWNSLKEKIFDSSVTIVLISPNMKEHIKSQSSQWIPQEISYSLKNITHNGRTSGTNGIVCVVLPDRFGSYNYYINDTYFGTTYNDNVTFDIIKNNRNNKKYGYGSYVITAKWDDFINNFNKYIDEAVDHKENIDDYNITKLI